MNDLMQYMSEAMERIVKQALKASWNNPAESAFLVRLLRSQKLAEQKRRNSAEAVPSFLIASIAAQCNLHCTGCYARANGACGSGKSAEELSSAQWERIFSEAEQMGIPFILLAGGEPLTRRDVLESAAHHRDTVFPVFTNGTLFDETYYRLLTKNRNLIPVLSLEGDRAETDLRRGNGVYEVLRAAMARMKESGVFYGTSITVTARNIGTVTDPAFIASLNDGGCKLIIFVEYVPVEPETKDLAPGEPERRFLAERQKQLREQFEQMIFLSFPGDEAALGGCLAAGRGFFHISTTGSAEPCPFSPYSDCSLKDHTLSEALRSPLFRRLREGGILQGDHSGGCVLFEKQEQVRRLSEAEG